MNFTSKKPLAGFTIVEMSVVLVIIAVILGAVSVGSDVLRNANGQRIFSTFVTGWSTAFSNYTSLTNVVPGDDEKNPTNLILMQVNLALCNESGAPELTKRFLAKGIALPAGSTPGEEDRYVYQDSNGSPHMLRVCFLTAEWSVPGRLVNEYVLAPRHVMRITGLTTELAIQLDTLIDGQPDQRFGQFRSVDQSASHSTTGMAWPPAKLESGEANIDEVSAYLELK